MSDQPVPLSRFRAALARPTGKKRVDALLAADNAREQVEALAVPELYFLIKDVGITDCYELLALATAEQVQGCVDLDTWDRDQPQLEAVQTWLEAAADAGYERLGQIWRGLDPELCSLALARWARIYDHSLGEAPGDDVDGPLIHTPDSFFTLQPRSEREDDVAWLVNLIEDLYRADADLARHTIMAARSEPAASLEEYAYRWRSGRMADLGYVDFYDALEVFRPLDLDSVSIGEGSSVDLPTATEDEPHSGLPTPMLEGVLGRRFLARALDRVSNPKDSERLEATLLVLVNRVLSAARVAPGDTDAIAVGTEHATATLALGLEGVSGGDLDRATAALESISLLRLHRVGYTMTLRLARLGKKLAPRAKAAGALSQAVLKAVLRARPFYPLDLDDPGCGDVRPFETTLELQKVATHLAELAFRIAIATELGIDLVALGEAPEPRAEIDDYLRTAVARALLGQELGTAPLTTEDLRTLLTRAFEAGQLREQARTGAARRIAELLDRAQIVVGHEHLPRLLQRWYDELTESLGGLDPATELDARFVGGVILASHRA